MPTYQYACTNPECGNQFELVQSFTDPAASECPVCGQPVRKRFGSVGVVFKGSGFYRTDSRAAASASSPSSGKSESKSESKPAESAAKKSESSTASGSGSSTKAAASA
jgi:putative FmdB family regulatory protein